MKEGDDRAQFADELRAMRKHAGWTQEELASRIGYSTSVVAMIEGGHRPATKDQAMRLDQAFGLPGTFQRMEERQRGIPYSTGFRPFTPYEARAKVLRVFEHSLIPGLLQTADYARAVLEAHPDTTSDEAAERAQARLARQAILDREDPPRLWFLLDESVLHRHVGSVKITGDALAHVAAMARRPGIAVQVIARDRPHPGLLGAFAIADLDNSPGIVYFESVTGGQTTEDPDVVADVALMFEALRTEALPGRASLALIEKVIQEQWT